MMMMTHGVMMKTRTIVMMMSLGVMMMPPFTVAMMTGTMIMMTLSTTMMMMMTRTIMMMESVRRMMMMRSVKASSHMMPHCVEMGGDRMMERNVKARCLTITRAVDTPLRRSMMWPRLKAQCVTMRRRQKVPHTPSTITGHHIRGAKELIDGNFGGAGRGW
jgi:hypothetical protein